MPLMNLAIYAGIVLATLLTLGLIITRLYRRATKEIGFVRTGFGGEKVVIIGDASHSPVQLLRPDFSPQYDTDPEQSAQTRAALFDRIEQEGLTFAAGHYPYPGFGGVVRVEGKPRWKALS